MVIAEVQIDATSNLRIMARRYRVLAESATDPMIRDVVGRLARRLEARAENIWADGLLYIRKPDVEKVSANDNVHPP
jgi:hypothetical protein